MGVGARGQRQRALRRALRQARRALRERPLAAALYLAACACVVLGVLAGVDALVEARDARPHPAAPFAAASPAQPGAPELHQVLAARPPAVRHRLVDEDVYATHEDAMAAWRAAQEVGEDKTRAVLVGEYAIPERVARAVGGAAAKDLAGRMAYMAKLRPHTDARVLVVHVQNGLGNRLRAMAGGIALAKATGRVPVVVWERDAHLSASFTDLFEHPAPREVAASGVGTKWRTAGVTKYDQYVPMRSGRPIQLTNEMEEFLYRDFVLLNSFLPWTELSAVDEPHWLAVNQMRKETDDTTVPLVFADDGSPGAVFLHDKEPQVLSRAYSVNETVDSSAAGDGSDNDGANIPSHGDQAPPGGAQDEDEGRRPSAGFAITPSHHLYVKTAYVPATLPFRRVMTKGDIDPLLRRLVPAHSVQQIVNKWMPSNIHSAVGVHIRSRSVDNDNVDVNRDCEYTSDGADLTDFWRRQSQVPVFVKKMDRYLGKNEAIHFFVATDDFRTIESLKVRFPGRISDISRTCDDRSPECVQFALADLMCLGRTRKIIGSNWSSFSEAAGRLSGGPLYLSGVHFGRVKPPSAIERWMKFFTETVSAPRLVALNPFYKCKTRDSSALASSTNRGRR